MSRTLGISPKIILPILGHLIVAIALAASGHWDLAWPYVTASVPITGLLGFVAKAGIVIGPAQDHPGITATIEPDVLEAAVKAEIAKRVAAAQAAAPSAAG